MAGATTAKRCSRCGETKPLTEFYIDRRRNSRCKQCSREITRQWANENPDRHRERARRWNRENPDRVKANRAQYAGRVNELQDALSEITARADKIRDACDEALRLDATVRGWTDREDLAQTILDILDGDT